MGFFKMVKTKKFVLLNHFDGLPKVSDFKIIEHDLRPLKDKEILTEAVWFSVDPYIRAYSTQMSVMNKIIGSQVARVIESKHPQYKVGDFICANIGWQTINTVTPDRQYAPNEVPVYKLPDFGDLPLSLALGVLGMPGNTAYFGFNEICKPKPGEVVVISGAAGAVGSHVAQIAKHKGCFVIGFAGTDEKVKYLLEDLKLDAAFNYKTTDLSAALTKIAPQGIDCYFDNVGGEISSTVIYQMNSKGRVSVCGSISSYNVDARNLPKAPILQPAIVFKQLKVEGFMVWQWNDRWQEGIKENLEAIKAGWLKYKEHVTEGFEKLPEAFIDMLQGGNTGKAVIKA